MRRCITSSIVVFSILLMLGASVGAYSGGIGSAGSPYEIANLDDWEELTTTSTDWDKHFILTDNLDLSGIVYYASPIAPDTDNSNSDHDGVRFTGSIEGQGHVIDNLTIEASDQDYAGLIGYLEGFSSGQGQVNNMILDNVSISGRNRTGGIAGHADGPAIRIESCSVSGTITGTVRVGGITGCCTSHVAVITNCRSVGIISGTDAVAGLVGQSSAVISRSFSEATIFATGNFVGGIIGHNLHGTVSDCYAAGSVTGAQRIGGLIGELQGTASNCYSTGAVSGGWLVGGLVGSGNPEDVSDSFWNTETSSQPASQGGTGLTTEEMMDIQTYLDAGWDFVDETENGTDDIWRLSYGFDYPGLSWEPLFKASRTWVGRVLSGSSVGATGIDMTLLGYNDWADVWYYFECDETGKYTARVFPDDFDSTLAVFDAAGVEIVFNDDYFGDTSAVILKASADRRYYIRVAGYDGQTGAFALSLQQGAIQAIQGDLNYDGVVNLVDLAIFANQWLSGL